MNEKPETGEDPKEPETGEESEETAFQPSQFGKGAASAGPPDVGPDAARDAAAPSPVAPAEAPAEAEEEGTVFAASPGAPIAPATGAPAPPPAPDAEEGTIFAAPGPGPGVQTPPISSAPAYTPTPSPPPMAPPPASARGGKPASIEVGTVLNHMFEVKRFLARGGMGEVFEGVNIASGERVAIKMILPELAADPNVMAMFQKEAQALTQLSHPAVVRYRGFALEPQLGFYYIATGFIDGQNLSDLLGKSSMTEDELFSLTRRLAEGLREAHELGVVHRDISPDNVILDADRLDRPKIIDFGIVKETDPGSKTIIGDGFAGKPSYVAPEQLGDFDKQVGPWSDVYSLALVTLAMAQGCKPDLGGLPAESIMKRRNGVDTSAVPDRLRPVIDRMLVADPQKRLRSMDDVIAALDKALAGKAPKKPKKAKAAPPASASGFDRPARALPPAKVLLGVGTAVAIALIAGIGYLASGGSDDATDAPATQQAASGTAKVPLEQVDAAVQAALPAIPCSWMTVETAPTGGGYSINGTGVAGSPLDAENGILQAARKLGVEPGTDFSGIARIDQSYCPILDELNKFRAGPPIRMTRKQPEYELEMLDKSDYAGQVGAQVVTDLSLDGIVGDFSIYSIERQNNIEQSIPSRQVLQDYVAAGGPDAQKLPGIENYRLSPYTNAKPGWAGLVLITGKGGFTPDALSDLVSPAGKTAFEARAKANDWKVQMIWYKFIDNQPNGVAGTIPTAPSPAASPPTAP